jgi:DNA-binding winged helix-turn-helix (wHTH) protein
MIYHDEIIEEVWKNRDRYAAEHHHNLHEIVRDLQKRQEKTSSNLVDRRNRTSGDR